MTPWFMFPVSAGLACGLSPAIARAREVATAFVLVLSRFAIDLGAS